MGTGHRMEDNPVTPAPDAADEPGPGVPVRELARGRVRRLGRWAVGLGKGEPFAVSPRCRHQLADLSKGAVDQEGCLVCPWHGSRYDVRSGKMVSGPKGFATYQGPTPGYTQFVRSYGKVLKLRRRRATVVEDRLVVED